MGGKKQRRTQRPRPSVAAKKVAGLLANECAAQAEARQSAGRWAACGRERDSQLHHILMAPLVRVARRHEGTHRAARGRGSICSGNR